MSLRRHRRATAAFGPDGGGRRELGLARGDRAPHRRLSSGPGIRPVGPGVQISDAHRGLRTAVVRFADGNGQKHRRGTKVTESTAAQSTITVDDGSALIRNAKINAEIRKKRLWAHAIVAFFAVVSFAPPGHRRRGVLSPLPRGRRRRRQRPSPGAAWHESAAPRPPSTPTPRRAGWSIQRTPTV